MPGRSKIVPAYYVYMKGNHFNISLKALYEKTLLVFLLTHNTSR